MPTTPEAVLAVSRFQRNKTGRSQRVDANIGSVINHKAQRQGRAKPIPFKKMLFFPGEDIAI